MQSKYQITPELADAINENQALILADNEGMDHEVATAYAMLESLADIHPDDDGWLEFIIEAVMEVAGSRMSEESMQDVSQVMLLHSLPITTVGH